MRGSALGRRSVGRRGAASGTCGAREGHVSCPPSSSGARAGYWRLENGNVPIAPPAYRGDTVVVLKGLKGAVPAAMTRHRRDHRLQAIPPLVWSVRGSVVEFKNTDRVAHDLGIADPDVMPVERLMAGQMRRRASTAGRLLRALRRVPPHRRSRWWWWTAAHAVVDDKGAFKIADAPDGKGTLKVWIARAAGSTTSRSRSGPSARTCRSRCTGSEARAATASRRRTSRHVPFQDLVRAGRAGRRAWPDRRLRGPPPRRPPHRTAGGRSASTARSTRPSRC